jgi:hypothetical protein
MDSNYNDSLELWSPQSCRIEVSFTTGIITHRSVKGGHQEIHTNSISNHSHNNYVIIVEILTITDSTWV